MKRPANKPKLRYSGSELVAVLPESSIAMILLAQELTKLVPTITELHQAAGDDDQAQGVARRAEPRHGGRTRAVGSGDGGRRQGHLKTPRPAR